MQHEGISSAEQAMAAAAEANLAALKKDKQAILGQLAALEEAAQDLTEHETTAPSVMSLVAGVGTWIYALPAAFSSSSAGTAAAGTSGDSNGTEAITVGRMHSAEAARRDSILRLHTSSTQTTKVRSTRRTLRAHTSAELLVPRTVFDALSSGNGWLGRGSPSTTAVSTKTRVDESEFDFLPQRGQRVNKTAVYKGREVKIVKAYSGRNRKGRWCALDIEWSASERRDLIANNPRPAETTAAVTSAAQNKCEI
jgi:hypothetical protein